MSIESMIPSKSSHPLSSPSPPALSLSQHQGLFQWVALCIKWPNYSSFSFCISPSSGYSGLISFRIDYYKHGYARIYLRFCFAFFLTPRSGIAESLIILFLVSWGNVILFSIVPTPFYIPINRAQGVQFLILANNVFSFLILFHSVPSLSLCFFLSFLFFW